MANSILLAGLTWAALGQVGYGPAPMPASSSGPVVAAPTIVTPQTSTGFSLPRLALPSLGAPAMGGPYYSGVPIDRSNPAITNAQGGQYGHEQLYPFDTWDNWHNGYWQSMPSYGGYHHFRPYNYKHVLSQTQTAGGWGLSPTHAYSHEYFRRKLMQQQMMQSPYGNQDGYPQMAPGGFSSGGYSGGPAMQPGANMRPMWSQQPPMSPRFSMMPQQMRQAATAITGSPTAAAQMSGQQFPQRDVVYPNSQFDGGNRFGPGQGSTPLQGPALGPGY